MAAARIAGAAGGVGEAEARVGKAAGRQRGAAAQGGARARDPRRGAGGEAAAGARDRDGLRAPLQLMFLALLALAAGIALRRRLRADDALPQPAPAARLLRHHLCVARQALAASFLHTQRARPAVSEVGGALAREDALTPSGRCSGCSNAAPAALLLQLLLAVSARLFLGNRLPLLPLLLLLADPLRSVLLFGVRLLPPPPFGGALCRVHTRTRTRTRTHTRTHTY
mmetsp:Transcript_44178/g.147343  ORF Transcript_44178/g.147343 Transcript_44178/m.147343 type:complete len:226 (+) Transcript_44178:245-922(+)